MDDEKARIIEALRAGVSDGLVSVSASVVELYGSILNDASLSDATKARFLSMSDDVPSRPELGHLYWVQSKAKGAILQAIGAKYADKLASEFTRLAADSSLTTRPLKQAVFSALRAFKSVAPVLSASAPDAAALEAGRVECASMVQPLMNSDFMSDRSFAFVTLLGLGGAEGAAAKKKAREEWCEHAIGTEQYVPARAKQSERKK
jgi:hypothetical protein